MGNSLLPRYGRSSIELRRVGHKNVQYSCSGGCRESIGHDEWMVQINGIKHVGGSGELHYHVRCFFKELIEALRIVGFLRFKSVREMLEEIEQEVLIEAILENGVKVR